MRESKFIWPSGGHIGWNQQNIPVATILHIGPGQRKITLYDHQQLIKDKLLITCPMDSGEKTDRILYKSPLDSEITDDK